MNEADDVVFCNCDNCPVEQVCCSSDAWSIILNGKEVKKFPHSMRSDGKVVMASGSDGYCIFRDPNTGKCKTYKDRPLVCKKFSCVGKDEEMKNLLTKHKEIRNNLDAKFCGMFVSFIHSNEKNIQISPTIINDIDNGKKLQLTPRYVYGDSEEEVRNKISEILSKPFKKEDI
jgi:Fe-S-cluster containining protein